MNHSLIKSVSLGLTCIIVSGCGDSSSSDSDGGLQDTGENANTTPLQGIAAVGAPVSSGTVEAHCSDGSGFTQTVTTDIDGSWQAEVNSDALPCMLKVSGGNPSVTLHSYTNTGGTTNITPITELIVATAANASPASIFASAASWPDPSAVSTAATGLLSGLSSSGFNVTEGLDPFNTPFVAESGNSYDDLLEGLQQAINDDANLSGLEALRDNLISGGALPSAPEGSDGDGGSDSNLSLTGDGSALSGQDGATGTVDGTEHTYTNLVSWDILPGDGSGLFQARAGENLPDSLTYWEVSGIDPAIGSYNCGQGGNPPNLKLIQGGVNHLAETCVIEINHVDSQSVSGRFAARFETLGTVTDGFFQLGDSGGSDDDDDSGGGDTGDNDALSTLNGRNGIVVTVNGHDYTFEDARGEKGAPTSNHRLFEFGDRWSTPADTTPFNGVADLFPNHVSLVLEAAAGGTQSCDSSVSMTVNVVGTGDENHKGEYTTTSCNIDITYISARSGVEGVITTAILENTAGNQVSLSNVPFRVYKHRGTDGTIDTLPQNLFASLNILSPGTFELGENQYFEADNGLNMSLSGDRAFGLGPDDGTQPFDGNASDRIVLQAQNLPSLTEGEAYACGIDHPGGGVGILGMLLKIGVYQAENIYRSSNPGGSCNLTVDNTYVGRYHDISYTATLVSSDDLLSEADRTVNLSGKFRNYGMQAIRAGNGGDEGELGSNEFGAHINIDEGSSHFVVGDRFKELLQFDPIGAGATHFDLTVGLLKLSNLPLAPGTYNCPDENAAGAVSMNVLTAQNITYLSTTFDRDSGSYVLHPGASCQVIVTDVSEGSVEGTFTGTLVAHSAREIMPEDNTISISGRFRNEILTP